MITPERTYRMLLRAYPAPFRAEFGAEMTTVFGDRWREMRATAVRFWTEILVDLSRSVPALRLEAARDAWSTHTLVEEVVMKMMAILAVLVEGISMLRGAPRARTLARTAALTSVAVFALIGLLHPLLSAVALLLGIGFPIALLIFFAIDRGRGQAPKMA